MSGSLRWEAPGKGDWRGLHDHFARAVTPEYRRVLHQGMVEGERVWIAEYGLPVDSIEPAFVNGRVFISPIPLVGPRTDRVPPAWALRLAVKLVPAFRRRARAAEHALAERSWVAAARRWFEVERAEVVAANAALDAVDVAALDAAGLADHLRAAQRRLDDGYRAHFRLHGPDLVPTGMFLGRARDWGIGADDATALLAGCSPASVATGDLPAWRLVSGYDLDERCAAELPARPAARAEAVEAFDPAPWRARVPAADREEFDRLLADARATYGVRDDNGLLTAAWPAGLLRRAMLEAGRRLAPAIPEAELAVELTVDELVGALLGTAEVDDPAARRAERLRRSAEVPPPQLGVTADLPLSALPPAMRAMVAAMFTVRDLGTTPPGDREPLTGTGIGRDVVVGRACVAIEAAEALARFEPGDILVTASTCPAWNSVLGLAGGVVTEEGGPLSHAAVIARELGLPAIVGAAHATAAVPDGSTIELDAAAGRVRVL